MTSERRKHERFQVWFPVQINAAQGGEQVLAITQNASAGGLLVASAAQIEAGATVTVVFRVPTEPADRRVQGKVLRIENNAADPHGMWPHKVVVEFSEPVAELEAVLRDSQRISQI